MTIIAYTDGSCIGNGKKSAIGGYGVFFVDDRFEEVSEPLTNDNGITVTNNRAELLAIITALNVVTETANGNKEDIVIYSDSKYCKLVIEKHCFSNKALSSTLKNPDLLKILHDQWTTIQVPVSVRYVEAHKKENVENDIADTLAVLGTAQAIMEKKLTGKLKAFDNMTYDQAFSRNLAPRDKLSKFVFAFMKQLDLKKPMHSLHE